MSDISNEIRYQWYASYHPERDSFVIERAGWDEEHPVTEYRFRFLIDPYTGGKLGGIDKIWRQSGSTWSDFYCFKSYRSKKAFEEDVVRIMRDARHLSYAKNKDLFMCVLDLIKARAVRARREYASIKDYIGLFDIGPVDAYSW